MDNDPSEFARLQVLHETGLLRAPPPPEFQAICQEAQERFGMAMALVTLIDRDWQVISAGVGCDLDRTSRSVAFCDWTIRADEILVVPDARQDPRFAENPLVTGDPFIRFYAGAPLIYLQRIRLGALCIIDFRPRDFSLGDRAELAALADRVVAVIAEREFAPPARLGRLALR
jgi:GAF domain-containing protein